MSTILLLLLLGPQEADRLVEQLGDEDIATRERVGEKLIGLGAVARLALERAVKSGDPEIRARARTLLGEIELAEQRARSLGAAYRMTLPPGEHSLGTIIERVREQTGVALKVPEDRRDARVRIEAREAFLLEFVDRLCQAQGGLTHAPRQTQDTIELVGGTPWKGPVWYTGPFRVWVDRLRLEQRDPYDSKFQRGSLLLGITWQPNVRPIASWYSAGKPEFTIREMRGDDGKVLQVKPDVEAPYSGLSLGSDGKRSVREFITFQHPARGVRRLAAIRGHVDVMLPLKIETVIFGKPLESVGQARKAGAYALSLRKCENTGEGVSVVLHLEAPAEGPGVEKRQQRVEIRSRFDGYGVELWAKMARLVGQRR